MCPFHICSYFQLWMDICVVPSLGAIMNKAGHSCIWLSVNVSHVSVGYVPRSGIAGSQGMCVVSFSRHCEQFTNWCVYCLNFNGELVERQLVDTPVPSIYCHCGFLPSSLCPPPPVCWNVTTISISGKG